MHFRCTNTRPSTVKMQSKNELQSAYFQRIEKVESRARTYHGPWTFGILVAMRSGMNCMHRYFRCTFPIGRMFPIGCMFPIGHTSRYSHQMCPLHTDCMGSPAVDYSRCSSSADSVCISRNYQTGRRKRPRSAFENCMTNIEAQTL